MRPLRPSPLDVGEAVVIAGGAAALAGSWVVVVVEDEVPAWEARLFEAVNGLPGRLWPVVWVPMQLGTFGASLAASAAAAAVTRDVRLTVAVLAASQAAYWTTKVIKRTAGRGRPASLLERVSVREHVTGMGYVSGHAAVAGALAAALAPSLPAGWRPVAVLAPALVGRGADVRRRPPAPRRRRRHGVRRAGRHPGPLGAGPGRRGPPRPLNRWHDRSA